MANRLGYDVEVNSEQYWNFRFGSGDWSAKGGLSQTAAFAKSQVRRFQLGSDFRGSLCDFGCGAGDSFPVYRDAFPNARLFGVDFSRDAIDLCQARFGELATFICGDPSVVPECDVIVCSNVLEHIGDDLETAALLQSRCKKLFVIVPYRESPLCEEHRRAYDDRSFQSLHPIRTEIFDSPGWSDNGWKGFVRVHGLNPLRFLMGRPVRRRRFQILYEFNGLIPQ
jgi:hypothetical protein